MIFSLCMLGCKNNVDMRNAIHGTIIISTQNEISALDIGSLAKSQPKWNKIVASKDEYRYPDLSPNGKQIVTGYLSWEEGQPTRRGPDTFYHLATLNADGTGERILLKDTENYEYPSWSPDGKLIACITYPNSSGDRKGKICILELTSKKLKCFEKYEVNVAKPAWSFDGHLLAFTTTKSEIALYDKNSDEVKLLPAIGKSPVFHPDGQHIFYIQTDNQALCSISIDGSDKKIVKNGFIDYLVKFSKDGQYLFYVGGGYHFMILPGPEYSTLELLNLKDLTSIRVDKLSALYGISWLE